MWEPIPGYLNPNSYKIAISDDESSWPEVWPIKLAMRMILAGLGHGMAILERTSLMLVRWFLQGI